MPIERLYEAVVDSSRRAIWLPDGRLSERTATRPKSARFDWADGPTRVNVTFLAKGDNKSTIALEHRRMASADEAEQMKNYWRSRIAALKGELEK